MHEVSENFFPPLFIYNLICFHAIKGQMHSFFGLFHFHSVSSPVIHLCFVMHLFLNGICLQKCICWWDEKKKIPAFIEKNTQQNILTIWSKQEISRQQTQHLQSTANKSAKQSASTHRRRSFFFFFLFLVRSVPALMKVSTWKAQRCYFLPITIWKMSSGGNSRTDGR